MPEALYEKTLEAMRKQKQRRVSFEGFGRLAAITAATAVLVVGAALSWRYLFGDWKPPDVMASPLPTEVSSPPDPSPDPPPTVPDGLHQLDLNFLIDIDWPEPSPYTPEVKVFPLTNVGMVYSTCMAGPVTFVDGQLNPVTLPFEVYGYAPINERGSGTFKGYSLSIEEDGYSYDILMLADGTVPRGADGRYIEIANIAEINGADGFLFYNAGSAIVTVRSVRNGNEGTTPLYGLYDMETQRETVPREYDRVELIDAENRCFFFSHSLGPSYLDGSLHYLFDGKGRLLYEFGMHHWQEFCININERCFYKISSLGSSQYPQWANSLIKWGDAYLAILYYENPCLLYILDGSGREIERMDFFNYSETVCGDRLVLATPDGFVLLDRAGGMTRFPAALDRSVRIRRYDGNEIFYVTDGYSEYYAADQSGRVRVAAPYEMEEGPVSMDYKAYVYFLRDENGGIALETDDYLSVSGNFILRSRYTDKVLRDRKDPYAVYNLNGRLLLENVYGYIHEVPGPGGGLFVYLDPDTCVLLYPDGRTVPVPAAPVVEKVYHGG
jgi:hypothetical protein